MPDVTYIGGKTVEQQQLQFTKRLRELAVKQQDASQKQLIALLLELNIKISSRKGDIILAIESVLEDATNDLSAECRRTIFLAKEHLIGRFESARHYYDGINKSVAAYSECKKLLKLESVGPMNAINLYIALGCAEIRTFSKGKGASACIGLPPIQHSSGGMVKLGSIRKLCKNSRLRSQLVCSATAAVQHAVKRKLKKMLGYRA